MSDDTQQHQNASRSGRIRRKNPFWDDFESTERNHTEASKRGKGRKSPATSTTRRKSVQRKSLSAGILPPPKSLTGTRPTSNWSINKTRTKELDSMHLHDEEVGDLEMDLPDDFNEADMPTLVAAEEVIEHDLLQGDEDKNSDTQSPLPSASRLKSQAESTYMLENKLEIANKPPRGRRSFGFSTFRSLTAAPPSKPGRAAGAKPEKSKPDRKGRITAYMLWAKDQRVVISERNPDLDFYGISRKLGEQWNDVSQAQKKMWKNRAAKQMKTSGENIKNTAPQKKPRGRRPKFPKVVNPNGQNTKVITGKKPISIGKIGRGGKKRKLTEPFVETQHEIIAPPPKRLPHEDIFLSKGRGRKPGLGKAKDYDQLPKKIEMVRNGRELIPDTGTIPEQNAVQSYPFSRGGSVLPESKRSGSNNTKLARDEEPIYKVTGTGPQDVAAYLVLLGESLTVIGQRLKEHEGQTSGSLSVLLDALICAMGPLLCLTQEVKELNVIPQETLNKTLHNIAYIMPGL